MSIEEKIKSFDELSCLVEDLKARGKKIVQSHGVFDIIHPGIIKHIQSAREQGDILIVSVIKDKDVSKGPGYPIFNENLRIRNVASIEYVDYVSLVDDTVPFESIALLKPDIFARGQDYKERNKEITKQIEHEEDAIKMAGCRIHYTPGTVFSSTNIINQFLDIYPEEIREYLRAFKEKYTPREIINLLKGLYDLRVLVIGDTIIDEYHYCQALGKSLKDNLVVNRYTSEETFAGGVLAVANHIAGLCQDIQLVTVLGKEESREDFISSRLKSNITPKFFFREDAPTIMKRRFIDQYFNKKLFEICYIDNTRIQEELENELTDYLNKQIPHFDLVLITDFGHGIITDKVIEIIEKKAKVSVINVQTNGANMGYNMITKFHNVSFACIDEAEARMAMQDRWGDIRGIAEKIAKHINSEAMIVTRGKNGSIGIMQNGDVNYTPALATTVVDRLGAGDAYLSFTAPCFAKRYPLDLVAFIGNAVGALAVQIVGNREPVEPRKLYEFIHTLFR